MPVWQRSNAPVDICLQIAPYKGAAMTRPRHPSKEIEAAVAYAESRGWRFRKARGHAWGRLLCPRNARDGCQLSVWSTPKAAEHHAAAIRRAVERCGHAHGDEE